MIYRKHVDHDSPKNFQLDLFTPDDGHFEYSAGATTLTLDLPALYAFICAAAPRRTPSPISRASSLSTSSRRATVVPTAPGSNSASSPATLRFLLVTRAGRLTRIGCRHALRLTHNPATEARYAAVNEHLAA